MTTTAKTFSQSEFQQNLTDFIVRMWRTGARRKAVAVKLHCGKAYQMLRRLGYDSTLADQMVEDCRDMAKLIVEVA